MCFEPRLGFLPQLEEEGNSGQDLSYHGAGVGPGGFGTSDLLHSSSSVSSQEEP